jgi:hypothetical protein
MYAKVYRATKPQPVAGRVVAGREELAVRSAVDMCAVKYPV